RWDTSESVNNGLIASAKGAAAVAVKSQHFCALSSSKQAGVLRQAQDTFAGDSLRAELVDAQGRVLRQAQDTSEELDLFAR
ncbi:MAG TPA: hypothetical protein VFM91_01425, partial [Propionibacteriaceae bacterium]|nr:hypothetical protein [Propionibacteriaceae bacterium]